MQVIFEDRTYRYIRLEVAFGVFFGDRGYCCDVCGDVVELDGGMDEPEHQPQCRKVAARALDNLDGFCKLMLCYFCSKKFNSFCLREFSREARVAYSPELEQMMIAFIAHEVMRRCKRLAAGQPIEPPRDVEMRKRLNEARHWPPSDAAIERSMS